MLCYVSLPSQPNSQCLGLEVDIDPKQTGQVVLDKVLEHLGILEVDYFGLQYRGTKREELWLNLRNRMCDHEIQGIHNVYRLSLRVKFFVPPHLVQQEKTMELFYTQIKDVMSRGLISLTEPYCDEAKLCRIVAAIAQAENEDRVGFQNLPYCEIIRKFCPDIDPKPSLIDQIQSEYSRLVGVPKVSARSFVLKEVSSLPGYGVEEHKTINAQGNDINFRVGPEGIILHESKTKTNRLIPYTQIRLATHNEKIVHIELLDDAGMPQDEECFKLVSRKAAVALYRCITEMHSFYRCDTVCTNVHSQYSRDFKGTFVSIFNENSDFGKRYIFDIQRTSREAYDLVRRKLYAKSSSPAGSPMHSPLSVENDENGNIERIDNKTTGEMTCEDENKTLLRENKKLKQKLELLEDSYLCCICMFEKVCIVLCPCGHMVCDTCSERIENCPQCRTAIERFQRVFHSFGTDCSKLSNAEHIV